MKVVRHPGYTPHKLEMQYVFLGISFFGPTYLGGRGGPLKGLKNLPTVIFKILDQILGAATNVPGA